MHRRGNDAGCEQRTSARTSKADGSHPLPGTRPVTAHGERSGATTEGKSAKRRARSLSDPSGVEV